MTESKFNSLIEKIEPLYLPFYLDEYDSKRHDINGEEMKAGKCIVQIVGTCVYTPLGGAVFNIHFIVWDEDNQEVLLTPKQHKELKITVLKNIVPNGKKYTAPIQSA